MEVEDPETGEPVNEPGGYGRMVITALNRMAQPCVRFDSKDIVRWSRYQCDCGRTFRMLDGGIIGRADDIIKVKGVLLAPSDIEEASRYLPELGGEYEVVVMEFA